MLDVHPPHTPTHTWKDFFIHIATIVVASRAPEGALSTQDTNELITAISDTQGKLARTERLVSFAQGALLDHRYDN